MNNRMVYILVDQDYKYLGVFSSLEHAKQMQSESLERLKDIDSDTSANVLSLGVIPQVIDNIQLLYDYIEEVIDQSVNNE